jgi:hypothetical protein
MIDWSAYAYRDRWVKFRLLNSEKDMYGHPVHREKGLIGFEAAPVAENAKASKRAFHEAFFFYEIDEVSWHRDLTEQEVFALHLAGKL